MYKNNSHIINKQDFERMRNKYREESLGNIDIRTIYNGSTNELVCNKTLIQMSHTKTFKFTPTLSLLIPKNAFVGTNKDSE
jgi:hypothetical protein